MMRYKKTPGFLGKPAVLGVVSWIPNGRNF